MKLLLYTFCLLVLYSISLCQIAVRLFFCHWQSSGLPVTLLNRVCCCSFYVFWLPYWLMRCPLGISDCWLPMWTQWPRMCVYSHARSDWLWPNNDQSLSYGTGNACRVGSGFNCCRKMCGSHLCVYDWKTCVRVCVCTDGFRLLWSEGKQRKKNFFCKGGKTHMRTKCSATVSMKSLLCCPKVCSEFV